MWPLRCSLRRCLQSNVTDITSLYNSSIQQCIILKSFLLVSLQRIVFVTRKRIFVILHYSAVKTIYVCLNVYPESILIFNRRITLYYIVIITYHSPIMKIKLDFCDNYMLYCLKKLYTVFLSYIITLSSYTLQ